MSKKNLEAALFVSKEPMTIEKFAEVLNEDKRAITRWMYELINEYANKGMIIKQVGGGFEMVSSPDCFDVISQIVPKEMEALPPASLETVSIVAYRQPVKRADIGKLRNIQNPDHGILLSIEKGLIRETENGFVTTDFFLEFFGINDLHELPEVVVETDFSEKHDDNLNIETEFDSEIDDNFNVIEHEVSMPSLDEDAQELLEGYVSDLKGNDSASNE